MFTLTTKSLLKKNNNRLKFKSLKYLTKQNQNCELKLIVIKVTSSLRTKLIKKLKFLLQKQPQVVTCKHKSESRD